MQKTLIAIAALYCMVVVLAGCQRQDADARQPSSSAAPKATVEKAEALEQNVAAGNDAAPSNSEIIARPEAQALDPTGAKPLDDALTCLARTIYWEARGESPASMEAVANVVMNRLGHNGFPNTVCAVVKQGNERGACQFSWWCDGRSDQAWEDTPYASAKEIARKALNQQLPDRTNGATYFHQNSVTPSWATTYVKTVEIDDFIFYKPSGS